MEMRMSWIVRGALALALAMAAGPLAAQESLSYVDLVGRLTDLERLAVPPAPGELCAQWSSYDRASSYSAATDAYLKWDANDDGAHFIRKIGEDFLVADIQGPGCLWRIWSARPEAGHVKIFLDGARTPAVDLPFIEYFDRTQAPFTRPALVHMTARGQNNYTPIPFQTSCRIVAEPNWGRYYHFTYSTFPKGTVVPTFRRELTAEESAALDEANRRLTEGLGQDPAGARGGEQTRTTLVGLGPGSTAPVLELAGPRAITAIRVRIDDLPPAPADRQVLRELALQIKWDGETEPSVWAPLGDFFGTAAGLNPYKSLPLGVTEDGQWYCLWFMPFAQSALIELVNDGKEQRNATFEITHAPLPRPAEQYARFHAKWHRNAFPPEDANRRAIDWTLLTANGAGRFCGVLLHVWNPKGGWWGEGDEKFLVDGEKFPSTFGTGSEDYFGYAWGSGELFQNAYHNQTISMGNTGHISVNRWHIPDNVPFQKSFDGYIEKYFPEDRALYAATAYWYLAAGGVDSYKPVPMEQRVYWDERAAVHAPGAREAESLKVIEATAGEAKPQSLTALAPAWSGQEQLRWTGAKAGETLRLEIAMRDEGRYRVAVVFTRGPSAGTVRVGLDDFKTTDPIDLYADAVRSGEPIDLGVHSLSKGNHTLIIEITGANEAVKDDIEVGIDYVRLEPLKK